MIESPGKILKFNLSNREFLYEPKKLAKREHLG